MMYHTSHISCFLKLFPKINKNGTNVVLISPAGSSKKQRLPLSSGIVEVVLSHVYIFIVLPDQKETGKTIQQSGRKITSLQKVIGKPPALKQQGMKNIKQKIWAFKNIFEEDTLLKVLPLKRINKFNLLFKIREKKVELIKLRILKFQPVKNLI